MEQLNIEAINAVFVHLDSSIGARIRVELVCNFAGRSIKYFKYFVSYSRDCQCDEGPNNHGCEGLLYIKDDARLDEYLADRLNGGFMPEGMVPCIEHLTAWGMMLLLENPSLGGGI